MWIALLLSIIALSCAQLHANSATGVSNVLSTTDHKAVRDSEFALAELKKLSDSRIYDTLSLSQIVSAVEEDGIYHFNTMLTVDLHSEYFKSGDSVERFNMVVMRNKIDQSVSLAIDEFPEMDEVAIERFWIEKVKERRRQRDELFNKLETEYLDWADDESPEF